MCATSKKGSTVTALALQKTYQGIIFWLAANKTVKPHSERFSDGNTLAAKERWENIEEDHGDPTAGAYCSLQQ